jgi:hypothetical protein
MVPERIDLTQDNASGMAICTEEESEKKKAKEVKTS